MPTVSLTEHIHPLSVELSLSSALYDRRVEGHPKSLLVDTLCVVLKCLLLRHQIPLPVLEESPPALPPLLAGQLLVVALSAAVHSFFFVRGSPVRRTDL